MGNVWQKKRVNDSKLGKSSSYGQGELSPLLRISLRKTQKTVPSEGWYAGISINQLPPSAAAGYSWNVQSLVLPGYPAYAGPQSLLRKPRAERSKMCMTDTGDTSRWIQELWIDNRRASLEPTVLDYIHFLCYWTGPITMHLLPTTFPVLASPVTNSDNQAELLCDLAPLPCWYPHHWLKLVKLSFPAICPHKQHWLTNFMGTDKHIITKPQEERMWLRL